MDIFVCTICIFLIIYFLLEDTINGLTASLSNVFDRKKKLKKNVWSDSDTTSEIATLVILDHYLNR